MFPLLNQITCGRTKGQASKAEPGRSGSLSIFGIPINHTHMYSTQRPWQHSFGAFGSNICTNELHGSKYSAHGGGEVVQASVVLKEQLDRLTSLTLIGKFGTFTTRVVMSRKNVMRETSFIMLCYQLTIFPLPKIWSFTCSF